MTVALPNKCSTIAAQLESGQSVWCTKYTVAIPYSDFLASADAGDQVRRDISTLRRQQASLLPLLFLFVFSSLLLITGCAPHYPQRSSAAFVPVSAEKTSLLAGYYQNQAVQNPRTRFYLWDGLTSGRTSFYGLIGPEIKSLAENKSHASDIVQIEISAPQTLRVRRIAEGFPLEWITLQGHFMDGYFYPDRKNVSLTAWGLVFGYGYDLNRLTVDQNSNLIVDHGGGGVLFSAILPYRIVSPSDVPVTSGLFARTMPPALPHRQIQ